MTASVVGQPGPAMPRELQLAMTLRPVTILGQQKAALSPFAFWPGQSHADPLLNFSKDLGVSLNLGLGNDNSSPVTSATKWEGCNVRFVSTPAQPGQAYKCAGQYAKTVLVKSDTPNFAIYGKCMGWGNSEEKDKTFLVPMKGEQWQAVYASALKAIANSFKDGTQLTLAIRYKTDGKDMENVQCASAIEVGFGPELD